MSGWSDLYRRDGAFRFGLAWVVFLSALFLCSITVNHVESREGYVLYDPLHFFAPIDFTYCILALEYFCVCLGLAYALRGHRRFIRLGYCYSLIFFLRTISLLVVPLSAPEGAIPLVDPLVRLFTGGVRFHMNDLFFSGHTAFCFVNFFLVPQGVQRWVIGACTLAVGAMLVIQRVHYTLDVFGALLAVVVILWLIKKMGCERERYKNGGTMPVPPNNPNL